MNTDRTIEAIDHNRRRLLGVAAIGITVAVPHAFSRRNWPPRPPATPSAPSASTYMKTTRMMAVAAALFIGSGLPLHTARSHEPGAARTDLQQHEKAATHGAPLRETVTVAADKPIPNLPGKRLVSLVVDYPPGASSASHHHARSAFIYAYVLSGEILSAVDGEPARVYRPGESWFESPGAHHRVSANASDTESARLLAVFIVDAADEALTIPDSH